MEFAFLFIGGPHQVFHLAPVAARLSQLAPRARVTCLYPDDETGNALEHVRGRMAADRLVLERIAPPAWAEGLARILHHQSLRKLPTLMRLATRLKRAAAIITPERTSAALRHMGLGRSLMIHFRHGAGDRAPSSESRLRAFDMVAVPGKKDVRRAVGVQHLDPARVRQCGYVKLDYLSRCGGARPALFPNDRPVVFYNAHFDLGLSSWARAREVVDAFRRQDAYNLVVAPHIRLGGDMSADERAEWTRLADPERIIVDFDSVRMIDMTYAQAADVYLGDMSSQFYEFLATPRPAVFVNAHGADWRADPRYAGWHLGEVVDEPGDIIAAVDRARERHPALIERQRDATREAFGDYGGAIERGAELILETTASFHGKAPPARTTQRPVAAH